MNVSKYVCRKRQALRLHIEAMKSTREHMALRINNTRDKDAAVHQAALSADKNLAKRIHEAQQELHFLEERWKW